MAQLQSVDGEAVGPAACAAPLAFTFHVALALRDVGPLDLVTAVALGPELQTRIQVASEQGRDETGGGKKDI